MIENMLIWLQALPRALFLGHASLVGMLGMLRSVKSATTSLHCRAHQTDQTRLTDAKHNDGMALPSLINPGSSSSGTTLVLLALIQGLRLQCFQGHEAKSETIQVVSKAAAQDSEQQSKILKGEEVAARLRLLYPDHQDVVLANFLDVDGPGELCRSRAGVRRHDNDRVAYRQDTLAHLAHLVLLLSAMLLVSVAVVASLE